MIRGVDTDFGYRVGMLTICLLALALRLHLLEDIALHDDEGVGQNRYVQQPAYYILTRYTPNNHWISSALGHFMGNIGPHRFLLRWPSVFLGTLTVPLMELAGRKFFGHRRAGLTAALLLCMSAFHLEWSQQFRGYSVLLFFTLLSFLFVYQALQSGRRQYWAGFLVAISLAILSHLYGVLALLTIAVILAGWSGYDRFTCRNEATPRRWLAMICWLSLVVAAYFAWFGKVYIIDVEHSLPKASLTQLIEFQGLAFTPTLSDIRKFLQDLAIAFTGQSGSSLALIMFWGFGFAGLMLVGRESLRWALFLGLWLTLPIAIVTLVELALAGFFVFERYLIFTLPAWLLLVTHTLTSGSRRLATHLPLADPQKPVIASILLGLGLGCLIWLNLQAAQRYFADRAGQDWRAVAAYLAENVAPTDLIICKQLPHRWPPRRLDLGDWCTKEMERRLADLDITPRFPIKQLEILASLNTGLRFKDQAKTRGAIWLIIWGEHVPMLISKVKRARSLTAGQGMSNLPEPLEAMPAAIAFGRLGHTLLLKVDEEASLAANLAQVLEYLARLDSISPDRFDYHLRRAQILAYQGHVLEAETELSHAREILNNKAEPLIETRKVIETIVVNFNQPLQEPNHRLDLEFGNPPILRLAEYRFPAKLHPNQVVPVTLVWQALSSISTDYTIFLHLRDSANHTLTQLDFRPFDGAYPTYQWTSNTLVEETRLWSLPDNLKAGYYDLYLGIYQVENLAHLPMATSPVTGWGGEQNGALIGRVWVAE